MLLLVRDIIEIVVPNNPTLGGMLLLAVLFADLAAADAVRRGDHRSFAVRVTLFTALDGRHRPAHREVPVHRRGRDRMPQRDDRPIPGGSRPSPGWQPRTSCAGSRRMPRTSCATHCRHCRASSRSRCCQARTPRRAHRDGPPRAEEHATAREDLRVTADPVPERRRGAHDLGRRASTSATCSRRRIARWEGHATALGVALTEQLDCEGVVEGDALLLGRLFDNLLENALAYTPRDGARRRRAHGPSTGLMCAVSITDSGPGIPASRCVRSIFERFSRGDARVRRKTGGAGLGLAICAAIVSAHKGTITLDDEYVGGTRIVVRLPVTRLSGRV